MSNTKYIMFDECSICFDIFNKKILTTKLDCNHIYHTVCIYDWAKKNNNTIITSKNNIVINGLCPICNTPFIKSINSNILNRVNKKLCCFIL